jgi:UDP-N-acetylglucosamine:LPS N-acetylglucosamine transferase
MHSERIVIVSASVGAGHDGAARELARRLRRDGYDVRCHDFIDLVPWRLGRLIRASYAWQLRLAPRSWGWLVEALGRDVTARLVARVAQAVSGRRVRAAVGPDPVAVVSTYPLASQALGRLRRTGRLEPPVITFLTDLSVHRLWVADGVDAHVAVHEVPAAQARRWGALGVRVAGPAVPPAFGPAVSRADQRAARRAFGLPAERPLALVSAGSWGVGEVEQAVRDIAACGVVTPVVACGHNDALRRRLVAAGLGIAVGWTDDMPSLVRACDVMVQNAGGLSSLEAIASGVPVITYRCLPGHGVTNARALADAGWAVWVRSPDGLARALKRAIAGEQPMPPATHPADPADVIATVAAR